MEENVLAVAIQKLNYLIPLKKKFIKTTVLIANIA